MELSTRSVAAYRAILEDPKKFGFPFRPIQEMFDQSEEVTASHLLFQAFQEEVPGLPKLMFYIILEEIYGGPNGKDKNGNLGYHLSFKPTPQKWTSK